MITRENAIRLFYTCYLAMQTGVPAYLLVGRDTPAQFGWQMFSRVILSSEISSEDEQGIRRAVDPARSQLYRVDLVEDARLLRHLCVSVPSAARLELKRSGGEPCVVDCSTRAATGDCLSTGQSDAECNE